MGVLTMRMAIYSKVNGEQVVTYREMTAAEIEALTAPTETEPSLEEQVADLSELVAILTEVICSD